MKKYLVTGGAGFIGSHIAEALVDQGKEVRILDNFETGKEENLSSFKNRIELIRGDIRDLDVCSQAMRGVGDVFHEAALGSVPRSVEDPKPTNDVNITGTLNLLLAAKEAKVRRFVYASSSSVYGDSPVLPKVETMAVNPLSPYALGKYAGEAYVKLFNNLYNLPTISLRYFNVFGPRQDPHSQYAAVIPRFITALLRGERPHVYGDGKQSRDFTFIKDVVQANLLALQADQEACGKVYNVACNQKYSLNQLIESLKEVIILKNQVVRDIQPVYEDFRAGDIKESRADISEAQVFLKYKPLVSFMEGLVQTVDFFLKTDFD